MPKNNNWGRPETKEQKRKRLQEDKIRQAEIRQREEEDRMREDKFSKDEDEWDGYARPSPPKKDWTKSLFIGLIICALVLALFKIISSASYGNRMEQSIVAAYENLEQQFGQFGQTVAESVGVTTLQADQMKDLFVSVTEARYGEGGSKAQLQMITEAVPNLDATVYANLQRVIEAGRGDFTQAQTRLSDVKRSYRTALGEPIQGLFLGFAGYPKIMIGYPLGMQDDYPLITTDRAAQTFEAGKECGNAVTAAQGTDGC